jgi:hypothetical protein
MILAFDLGSISSQAKIQSAQLRLDLDYKVGDFHFEVRRVSHATNWREYEVSWNGPRNGTMWMKPGGDYVGEPVLTTWMGSQLQADVTRDVADFVGQSAENQGWIIRDARDNPNACPTTDPWAYFHARESQSTKLRPRLVVLYCE